MAKTVYARAAGGNWSADATWSTTSGGGADTTKPVAGDTAIFDANSGSVTIDVASACTFVTMTDYPADKTFTMNGTLTTAGNVSLPTAAVTFAGTSDWIMTSTCTITPNNKILSGGIQFNGAVTYTISGSQLGIGGVTTIGATARINGQSVACRGGITLTGGINALSTTNIYLMGGTWQGAGFLRTAGVIYLQGDVTVSGEVLLGTTTLTYVSGTITTTDSTVTSNGTLVFDTNGVIWNTVLLLGSATINSLFTAETITLPNTAFTFSGVAGFSVGTLNNTSLSAARVVTFKEGITYRVRDALDVEGSSATSTYSFTSAHESTKTIITLDYGATQACLFVNPTRIDSSLGQAIYCKGGTITDSYNWATQATAGTIIGTGGGETVAVAGITKDNNGDVLGSCDCYLFRDNGNDTATFLQYQESNASTGAYSFSVYPGSTYFVAAFKAGAPAVMDVTDRTLTAA